MKSNKPKQSQNYHGFTLIEVLFATAITAMLLSAISLNLGIKPALQKVVNTLSPETVLIDRLDTIFVEQSIAELIALSGVSANSNSLSDPAGTSDRILVSIEETSTGLGAYQTSLYAIKVASDSKELTRWFSH